MWEVVELDETNGSFEKLQAFESKDEAIDFRLTQNGNPCLVLYAGEILPDTPEGTALVNDVISLNDGMVERYSNSNLRADNTSTYAGNACAGECYSQYDSIRKKWLCICFYCVGDNQACWEVKCRGNAPP